MENYICENVFVPLRSGPSHKSEMLSQVLFGEKYSILEYIDHWARIETLFDKYQGWIDTDHMQQSIWNGSSKSHVLNKQLLCFKNDRTKLVLEPGCELHDPDFKNKSFKTADTAYTTCADFNESYVSLNEGIADTAIKFMNSPYLWGGRIPSGIDCSGFTQLIYKLRGVSIPRDSWQQAEIGEQVSFIEETKPGDLVFFDNEQGKISHVGMIHSKGLCIHASGRVRIDTIDHQGIYKSEKKGYSHKLRTIRRVVE